MRDKDSLKQRIHSGELVIGVVAPVSAGRDRLEEILSKDSYDFIWVDSQHAAFNEERLVEMCKMAEEIGMQVLLRIKHTRHTYLVGNNLDLGPSGIEVPQVEEEATVVEAIDNFYYPQVGIRSWGGLARPRFTDGTDRVEYAGWWNGYGVLWIQVESIAAVADARKLAKPGVDCLSFGPADLSFDLEGHPGHTLKSVDDCVRHVLEELKDTDVKVCFRNYVPELRDKYIDMGVTVLLERPRR